MEILTEVAISVTFKESIGKADRNDIINNYEARNTK